MSLSLKKGGGAIQLLLLFILQALSESHSFNVFLSQSKEDTTPPKFHEVAQLLIDSNRTSLFNERRGTLERTLLQQAVSDMELENGTLALLAQNGANFSQVDKNGNSLLPYAIAGGRTPQFLSNLISYGVDVNAVNLHGNSPLHRAVRLGQGEVVKIIQLLIKNGADVNLRNNMGRTALQEAALNEDSQTRLQIIQYLIENNGVDVSSEYVGGRTFLHVLLARGDAASLITPHQLHEIVEVLVLNNHTGLFDVPSGVTQDTPLMWAVKNLEVEGETLQLLHENGVDFNSVDWEGNAALFYAVRGARSTDLLSCLVADGNANPNHVNENGESLLHIAARYGNKPALELFLNNFKLDPNAVEKFGSSPLHFAIRFGKDKKTLEFVRFLVERGADVNLQRENDRTSLLDAAYMLTASRSFLLNVIRYLLENGASSSLTDDQGYTFLHALAASHATPVQLRNVAEMLVKMNENFVNLFATPGGADLATPLQLAVKRMEVDNSTLALLQTSGLNFSMILDNNRTGLLYYAVVGDRSVELLKNLVRFGADLGLINERRQSILHVAAKFGTVIQLKFLIRFRVLYVNAQDFEGNTPLHEALGRKEGEMRDMAQVLFDKGADLGIANREGSKPFNMLLTKVGDEHCDCY